MNTSLDIRYFFRFVKSDNDTKVKAILVGFFLDFLAELCTHTKTLRNYLTTAPSEFRKR